MSVLKIKNTAGEWIDIPAIKGANGKDGKEYDDTEIKAEITALKGYVDDKCENSSLNTFVVPYNINFTVTYNDYKLTITNEDLISKIQEIVNTAYAKEMQKINLQILINGSPTLLKCDYYHSSSTDTTNAGRYITEKPSELRYFSTDIPYQIGNSSNSYSNTYAGYSSLSLVLYVKLSWENDEATVTSLFMKSYAPRGRFVGEDFIADYYLSKYNSKAYTPTANYHPATKKYVDDISGQLSNLETEDKTNLVNAINEALNSGGGNDFPVYTKKAIWTNFAMDGSSYSNITSDTEIVNILTEFINEVYKTENKRGKLTLISLPKNYNSVLEADFYIYLPTQETTIYMMSIVRLQSLMTYSYYKKNLLTVQAQIFGISVRWSDNLATITNLSLSKDGLDDGISMGSTIAMKEDLLAKNNTASYTPTSNYHPATKKYVDDTIASAITTTLGGEY